MDNETLINKYRERLLKVHFATVTIVSFVEILAYFIFVYMGMHPLSMHSRYLWVSVVLPICINAITHFVAHKVCRSEKIPMKVKNNSVIYAAFVTTFVVSLFHRDYIVTSCAFVFPVILSAMYNDIKILRKSVVLALVSLTATVVVLFAENKLNLTTSMNVMVLYGFVAVSYLSGDLSIKFSQSNFSLIEEQADVIEEQADVIEEQADVIEEQADANSKLETILDLDPMTHIFNHETFYEKLDEAIAEAEKGGKGYCVAMIDIDHFKTINDTYGHNAGDTVLIVLADILRQSCDEGDSACRYGGEEFGIIFRGKTSAQAEQIVRDALKSFTGYKFDFAEEHFTFSCGITDGVPGDTKEGAFDRADDLLYISKKNGRNRITL